MPLTASPRYRLSRWPEPPPGRLTIEYREQTFHLHNTKTGAILFSSLEVLEVRHLAAWQYGVPDRDWEGEDAGWLEDAPVTDEELAVLREARAGYSDLGSAMGGIRSALGARWRLVLRAAALGGLCDADIRPGSLHAFSWPRSSSVPEALRLLQTLAENRHHPWFWEDSADFLVEVLPDEPLLAALPEVPEPLRTQLAFCLVRTGRLPMSALPADQRARIAAVWVVTREPEHRGMRGAALEPDAWRAEMLAAAAAAKSPIPSPHALFPFLLGAGPGDVVRLLCRDHWALVDIVAFLDAHPADLTPALRRHAAALQEERGWSGESAAAITVLALSRRTAGWPASLDRLLARALCPRELLQHAALLERMRQLLAALPPARRESLLLSPSPDASRLARFAFLDAAPTRAVLSAYLSAVTGLTGHASQANGGPESLGYDQIMVDGLARVGDEILPLLSAQHLPDLHVRARRVLAATLAAIRAPASRALLKTLAGDTDEGVAVFVARRLQPAAAQPLSPQDAARALKAIKAADRANIRRPIQERFAHYGPLDVVLLQVMVAQLQEAYDSLLPYWILGVAEALPRAEAAPVLASMLVSAPAEHWLRQILSLLSPDPTGARPWSYPALSSAVAEAVCQLLLTRPAASERDLLRWLTEGVSTSRSYPPPVKPTHGPPDAPRIPALLVDRMSRPVPMIQRICTYGLRRYPGLLPPKPPPPPGVSADWADRLLDGAHQLGALARWGSYCLALRDTEHSRAVFSFCDRADDAEDWQGHRGQIETALAEVTLPEVPLDAINALLTAMAPETFAPLGDPRVRCWQEHPPLTEVPPERARQLAGIGADLDDRCMLDLEEALDAFMSAAVLGDVRFYETRHELIYEHVVFQGGLILIGPGRAAILWYLNNQ